jgi:AraC family transcriptional activator of pobA
MVASLVFVQALAIDLALAPQARERIGGLLKNLIAEASWPHFGHTLMLEWLARSALLLVRIDAETGRPPRI